MTVVYYGVVIIMFLCCAFSVLTFIFVVICVFVSRLFFFFFKQKTAYEMRISDWSSDVCSSDLAPRIDPSAFIAPGCRIIGDVEIGPDVYGAQQHAPVQIGRASCRERVCQYV